MKPVKIFFFENPGPDPPEDPPKILFNLSLNLLMASSMSGGPSFLPQGSLLLLYEWQLFINNN